jgi:serine/threonine protein kinase/Tfp pilus assembly protein PilF
MIGTTLTHYRITGRLGQGGMGEVFRATDTKLGREVAIKVLPPAIAQDPQGLARFDREAKALAALNHPHIASIYGFDADQRQHFLVLELVEGETLAERLRRGRLSVEEALRVAQQIAEAVAAAHVKGIIHRDLKPGNIKFTSDGRVKVLDFGLAKIALLGSAGVRAGLAPQPGVSSGQSGASVAEEATIQAETTTPGAVLGTPAYMSPEQARGQEVDQRTDVWAFGCCLFESLAGIKPFRGETVTDMVAEVLRSEPPWAALPADTPGEVLTLLRHCLKKDPRRRLSSLSDIALTLEETSQTRQPNLAVLATAEAKPGAPVTAKALLSSRFGLILGSTVLAFSLAIAGIAFWRQPKPTAGVATTSPGTQEQRKTLAVLPFEGIGSGVADNDFNEGLTIELITLLQNVKGLQVQGPMASLRFKGSNDPKQVGEQLKVDHLLQGKVSRAGDRLRINVNLQKAADGFGLWATNYDRKFSDIFAIQTEVAQQVAEALKLTLGVDENRALVRQPTDNSEAYSLYLQGRAAWSRRTLLDFERAVTFFTQALQKDTNYALAYAGLADVHVLWPIYAQRVGTKLRAEDRHPEQAIECARKALDLDPTLAEPHAALGWARALYRWDWTGAEKEFRAAILLNPKAANAYHWYADMLLCVGRPEEALHLAEMAVHLDPSPINHNSYAFALISTGQLDAGIAYVRKRIEQEPWFQTYQSTLLRGYYRKGDIGNVVSTIEHQSGSQLTGNSLLTQSLLSALKGRPTEAKAILREAGQSIPPSIQLVSTLYLLSEDDRALDILEQIVEQHQMIDPWTFDTRVDWKRLHNHPRYRAALRKLNVQD